MRIGVSCGSAGRRRAGLPVAVVAAVLLLGGCSTMEKAGEGIKSVASALNPFNWFSGEEEPDYTAGETVVAQKPQAPGAAAAAKQDETAPPLSSVPDRPKRLTSASAKAERKALQDGLAADAENARHTDHALRAGQPGVRNADAARSPDRIADGAGATAGRAYRMPVVPTVTVPTGSAPGATPAAAGPASGDAVNGDGDAAKPAAKDVAAPKRVSSQPRGALRSVQVATIYFADGATDLTPLDQEVVRQVAEVAQRTGGTVRVIGHSSVGDPSADPDRRQSSNFRVSLKRANAVAAELRRYGVPVDRVQVSARGDSEPVYLETAATGAAGNRRAEVFLDYFGGT